MVMSYLAKVFSSVLETERRVKRLHTGESGVIELLTVNATTGALTVLKTASASWDLKHVRDGLGGFMEYFQVAEFGITATEASQIHAVRFNGNQYRVSVKRAMSALQRYWFLHVQSVEKAENL